MRSKPMSWVLGVVGMLALLACSDEVSPVRPAPPPSSPTSPTSAVQPPEPQAPLIDDYMQYMQAHRAELLAELKARSVIEQLAPASIHCPKPEPGRSMVCGQSLRAQAGEQAGEGAYVVLGTAVVITPLTPKSMPVRVELDHDGLFEVQLPLRAASVRVCIEDHEAAANGGTCKRIGLTRGRAVVAIHASADSPQRTLAWVTNREQP